MTSHAISGYALLSDRHSAALVSSHGSIDWLCMPRFDSPSVFAALLDDDAGHWSIRPSGGFEVNRRYVEGGMVLDTAFHTGEGTLEVRDALTLGTTRDVHRLGEQAPHLLVRSVTCTRGAVSVDMVFRPRPEYGLIRPVLTPVAGGLVATGGADRLTLSSPVPLAVGPGEARAGFALAAGERVSFAVQYASLSAPQPPICHGPELTAAVDGTIRGWRDWSDQHQSYQGRWRDLVHHSGRVLQALSYQPTGAIVAAPTTSLPEQAGGSRNWDYRYSWVRDASLTMQALWVAACPDEAHEFFDFMATAAASPGTDRPLQVMFGVGGEHDLTERTLPHLSGWRASSPVRVGNAAWSQPQLDTYGELLGAASRLRDQIADLDRRTRDFLVGLADAAASRWRQPDNGIWEIRGQPRHFVHSKVMCWVALDRARAMADWLDARDHAAGWRAAADEVRAAVLAEGWDETLGSFTQSFGSRDLDATALLLPIVGFLPPDDPRVVSTLDVVVEQLTDQRGLVRRYLPTTGVDGLDGQEGSFLLCTFWLAEALALAGRPSEAAKVFERATAHLNDVGLLAEEVDSATGEQLGNFPQAFSHIGLVNAAWAIDQGREAGVTVEGSSGE